jgi:protein-S-isoprenylcysteine O-methyltransferase Ste14
VVPDVADDPRDYNQPIPEPEDPRDLPVPPRLRPGAVEHTYRNGMATVGMYIAATAVVLEVLVGTFSVTFLALISLCLGLTGWARLHRRQANNGRTVAICLVLSVAALAVSGFWSTRTGGCNYVDPQKKAACVSRNVGLL